MHIVDCSDLSPAESRHAAQIAAALHALADPFKAEGMRTYMKDHFEYLGVTSPDRRAAIRPFLQIPPGVDLEKLAACLYQQEYRELHYAALELLERDAKKAPEQRIQLYEQLMEQSQWWDSIDWIASKLLGTHFRRFPHLIPQYHAQWMDSDDIWLQRCCLLFQLHYKTALDEELLLRTIEALRFSNEFFIQKAIGWILRQYARSNPDWVRELTACIDLKPLSRREALKHLK